MTTRSSIISRWSYYILVLLIFGAEKLKVAIKIFSYIDI
jgi:hypothetical protein